MCSLCSVWLYFKDDSLEEDALGGGAGTCLDFPVGEEGDISFVTTSSL